MKKINFSFGKNWAEFLTKYFDNETLHEAWTSLSTFMNLKNLRNKTFLDIGCGSGLFSYIAYKSGAKEIVSLDIDPFSVECCKNLHTKVKSPKNWRIIHGSILDKKLVLSLNKFDIVYAWGSLHHTGKMWDAIKNTAQLVKKNGYLYLAIYNKAECWGVWKDGRFGTSNFWLLVKKIYAHLPTFIQYPIFNISALLLIIFYMLTFRNPIKQIKSHKKYRGMHWITIIKDWLGGYPYEFATPDEIFLFLKKLGFSLENLKTYSGLLNNEYLFKKIK